jgi:hypothetical protein
MVEMKYTDKQYEFEVCTRLNYCCEAVEYEVAGGEYQSNDFFYSLDKHTVSMNNSNKDNPTPVDRLHRAIFDETVW